MGGDGMTEEEFAELSAGHALGALSADDEARFIAALDAHPARRRLADLDIETAAELGAEAAPVAPPSALKADLLALIAQTPHNVTEAPAPQVDAEESEPVRTPRRRRWFALAASIALVLAVAGGTIAVVTNATRPAAVIALERIDAAPDAQSAEGPMPDGRLAELRWSPSLGEAVLVADDMPVLSDDQSYELWYVREGVPISAGVFEAPAEGTATAVLQGAMELGDIVAVTIEPAGGSPDGKPSSDPIVAITTA